MGGLYLSHIDKRQRQETEGWDTSDHSEEDGHSARWAR
jgi:hypothetical protein